MITRLLTLLVVFCCFFSYSNAYAEADLLSPNGMTQIMNGVDDGTYHIQLEHNFPYYGGVFTDAWMSSNGFVMFYDPTSGFGNNHTWNNGCCSGFNPINNNTFSYMIAPLWNDLRDPNASSDDGYYYNTNKDGSSFLWYNVYEYGTTNKNTFQVDIFPDGSFDMIFDEVDITRHSVWVGFTGDTSKSLEIKEQIYSQSNLTEFDMDFATQVNGGRVWYGVDGGYGETGPDCSNPLNDTSCPGYETAYTEQQCSQDSLYDSSCPGYAEAYYSYQCSLDALYDNGCPGYAEAFTEQQCELNPQYSPVCNGYVFPVAEITVSEPAPVIEETIQVIEQVQEVQIIEQSQEIAEEQTIIEESEEEIVELSIALEQNDEKTEKLEEKPKNTRRKAAIAGSLESTQQLLQQIIGSSMSSGTNESNLQGSTGDLYGNDSQNMNNLQNSSTDSQETLSQNSTSEQDSQNLNDSMALGPSLNLGISLLVNNEPKEEQKENKKPTLAERMAKMIQKKNLENQTGIFGGQESVLTDMANGADINKYYEERLADTLSWYNTKDIYGGNRMTDSNKSFYRLNSENHGTMQQLIRSQY